ncbi:hypothetical protein os1_00220 [Comamonadaceae bacterium OS-1]|nr:hypothetical protein os1_00220 [Comamonadaceae bacterium OS-1]
MRPNGAVLRWCVYLLLCYLPIARAQSTLVEINQMQIERNDSGVFFSANLKFELPSLVEDALHKGIPMFFVAEIEVLRDRWYWSDKAVASQARYMRLAYQPLTRRWRLNVGPTAMGNSGLGVVLNQNFESLADALANMQRFSRWRIADAADIDFDGKTHAEFSFRLDVSQLPRPFQIGAMGQSDWNLSGSRNLRLTPDATK